MANLKCPFCKEFISREESQVFCPSCKRAFPFATNFLDYKSYIDWATQDSDITEIVYEPPVVDTTYVEHEEISDERSSSKFKLTVAVWLVALIATLSLVLYVISSFNSKESPRVKSSASSQTSTSEGEEPTESYNPYIIGYFKFATNKEPYVGYMNMYDVLSRAYNINYDENYAKAILTFNGLNPDMEMPRPRDVDGIYLPSTNAIGLIMNGDESIKWDNQGAVPDMDTIQVFSGPSENKVYVDWTETELEPTVMYPHVSRGSYLNVLYGPDLSYGVAGYLTKDQSIIAVGVAVGTNGEMYYKTQDGYYVNAVFFS